MPRPTSRQRRRRTRGAGSRQSSRVTSAPSFVSGNAEEIQAHEKLSELSLQESLQESRWGWDGDEFETGSDLFFGRSAGPAGTANNCQAVQPIVTRPRSAPRPQLPSTTPDAVHGTVRTKSTRPVTASSPSQKCKVVSGFPRQVGGLHRRIVRVSNNGSDLGLYSDRAMRSPEPPPWVLVGVQQSPPRTNAGRWPGHTRSHVTNSVHASDASSTDWHHVREYRPLSVPSAAQRPCTASEPQQQSERVGIVTGPVVAFRPPRVLQRRPQSAITISANSASVAASELPGYSASAAQRGCNRSVSLSSHTSRHLHRGRSHMAPPNHRVGRSSTGDTDLIGNAQPTTGMFAIDAVTPGVSTMQPDGAISRLDVNQSRCLKIGENTSRLTAASAGRVYDADGIHDADMIR